MAPQAIAILRELHALTGRGKCLFPGLRSSNHPMSENTINAALRRLGYTKEQFTGHAFRSSLASTVLNEQGWHRDAIEVQPAHVEHNPVRRAYNRAQYLPEKRKMMVACADFLDGLHQGADVLTLKRTRHD